MEIVIAGAGIIGLSAALELRRHGHEVTVLEQGHPMQEASWAAAGMLAARDPENPGALREMAEFSLQLYPAFCARVKQLSQLPVPFRTQWTLQGSRRGTALAEHGAELGKRVSSQQAVELAPGLNTEGREFLLLEEHSLAPRDLCRALPLAVRAAGVRVEEQVEVQQTRPLDEGRIQILTSMGMREADAFLNCGGAWAGRLAAPRVTGLEPRKGQIATLFLEDSQLKGVIRTPETYLVPRGDGRIVIGATVERTGFDKGVETEVIARLVEEACTLYPPLRQARIVETWAGLRPGSHDGLPVLGQLGPSEWIAAGHFRNGILLAPATAVLLQQLLAGQPTTVALDRFLPHRSKKAGY